MQITGVAQQNGNLSSEAAPLMQETQSSAAANEKKDWILISSLLGSQNVDAFDSDSNG